MIDWFTNLKNKNQYEFIKFDGISFYTSITEKLLDKAILFGKNDTEIEKKDIKILKNAANSVLCNGKEIWIKREKTTATQLLISPWAVTMVRSFANWWAFICCTEYAE